MILDRRENALRYLGLSKEMDTALHYVHDMRVGKLEAGVRTELDGERVFNVVSEVTLAQRPMNFEYHRRYIDIHLPVTGTELIALCPTSGKPDDATFDAEKDVGFFDGRAVNKVAVPAGWFCVCFPDDAHVPGIGEDGHAIVKVIVKVAAE